MALSDKTLQFLFENRMQNSRDWFHSHKEAYQAHVVKPMRELAEYLLPFMLELDPKINPNFRKIISRINRDTRFTKDKSFYRDVMWLVFYREQDSLADSPAFYFEFSPEGFRYGCGYYQAPPKVMDSLRQMILEGDLLFQESQKALQGQEHFTLEGDLYKRPHYPEQPEDLRNWLERRNIFIVHSSKDPSVLFSEHLGDDLLKGFRSIAPIYNMLCAASMRAAERAISN